MEDKKKGSSLRPNSLSQPFHFNISCHINSSLSVHTPFMFLNASFSQQMNSARIKICQGFICGSWKETSQVLFLRFPRETLSLTSSHYCDMREEWVCSVDLLDAGLGVWMWGPEALISPLQAWWSRPWCSSSASWSPFSSLSCQSCTDRIWSCFRSCGACGERRRFAHSLNFSGSGLHD